MNEWVSCEEGERERCVCKNVENVNISNGKEVQASKKAGYQHMARG